MSVVLVTGATRGIGREAARRLAELGHTVVLGARDLDRGRVVAADVGGTAVELDITDTGSVTAALTEVGERHGRLDVLVNNAGIPDNTVGVEGIDGDTALRVLDTNVAGVVRVVQAALPLLRTAENPAVGAEAAEVVVAAVTAGPDGPTGVALEEHGVLAW